MEISVILPIKSALATNFDEMFNNAISSVVTQSYPVKELVIVHTGEETLVSHLDNFDFSGLTVNRVLFTEEPNFCSQVNKGVESASSEWVSLLEFDDEYSPIWFKNVKKYVEYYNDVDVFLPVVIDIDDKGVFAGFTNEATFAANFSQEIGYLSNDMLNQYQNFQIAGMVIKKERFIEYGGFKPSVKLTFGWEFFLRMTYNSVRIMTIPRFGYKHINMRPGGVFWNYKNGSDVMTEDEVKFWIDIAKKEHFFTSDREIKYEAQSI